MNLNRKTDHKVVQIIKEKLKNRSRGND
jgi:hypothetical protein